MTRPPERATGTVVVYVHGLWLSGWESAWLRRRIERALDCRAHTFRYRSVSGRLTQHAANLARYLAGLRAERLHLIGHSMGGLVILECFERFVDPTGRLAPDVVLPPGRILLLGSPVRGSQAARRLARLRYGPAVMGSTAHDVLLSPRGYYWRGARDLGIIAGNLAVGLGRFMGKLPQPSDGTVMVEETDLPGATEQLTLPVSHSGLLISPSVAQQAIAFLRDGHFARA